MTEDMLIKEAVRCTGKSEKIIFQEAAHAKFKKEPERSGWQREFEDWRNGVRSLPDYVTAYCEKLVGECKKNDGP